MNMVGMLLDYGANVYALSGGFPKDTHFIYERAIDVAVERSRLDMVHFLITAGSSWSDRF